MDAKTLFSKAAKQADVCVGHVHDNQLTNKTPCSEWNLKELINHVVYELCWVPDLLAGKTVADVGTKYDGNLLGDDYGRSWKNALDKAQLAVDNADLQAKVHLSYGDVLAEHYIREIGTDLAIHGWDISQSEMCNLIIADDLTQSIYDFMSPRVEEISNSTVFGPAIVVAESEPLQSKLLGMLGRKANTWE